MLGWLHKPCIKVYYHNMEMPELVQHGNWIDLYAVKEYQYQAGDIFLIDLGVSIILPKHYEALLVPRSSTFLKYGLLQTNSIGIIDTDFCGPNDIWKLPVYAIKSGVVPKFARVAQFRIISSMQAKLTSVPELQTTSRGGFGSTGI